MNTRGGNRTRSFNTPPVLTNLLTFRARPG
jgi:hypothetical protein